MSGLWIRAIGAATSMGDLYTACAAYRAGLSAPMAAPDVSFMVSGDDEPSTVAVHAVEEVVGFEQVGRLVALLELALADLVTRLELERLAPDTILVLALPDPEERGIALGREFSDEEPGAQEERLEGLAVRLVTMLPSPAKESLGRLPRVVVGGGHDAFARALEAASKAIAANSVSGALICAIDSLASPHALQMGMEDRRVKTPDYAVGYIPGEAAVCVMVERSTHPDARKVRTATFVSELAFAAEQNPFRSPGRRTDGRALADCALRASARALQAGGTPVLLSDHDGQESRAYELGIAQVHWKRRAPSLADAPLWLPAEGFGNTGVVSGALAAALALRAFERSYAGATTAIVLSSNDGGDRAAFAIHAQMNPEAKRW